MTAKEKRATDQVRLYPSTRRLARKEAADEDVTLAELIEKAVIAYKEGKKSK